MKSTYWACPDAEVVLPASVMGADPERWLEERRKGIGGSDMAQLMGHTVFGRTEYDLWLDKTGRTGPIETSEAMLWGQRLESSIADAAAVSLGLVVQRRGLLRSKNTEHLLVSVDRLTSDGGGMEVKNVNQHRKLPRDGSLPPDWWWQDVTALAVTGRTHWYHAGLVGGSQLKLWEVKRDDPGDEHRPSVAEAIQAIHEKVPQWWHQHVILDRPAGVTEASVDPAWERTDQVRDAVLPELLYEQRRQLIDLRGRIAEDGAELEALRQELIAQAAGARYLGVNGVPVIELRPVRGRRSFKVAQFHAARPEINLDNYYETGAGSVSVHAIGDQP